MKADQLWQGALGELQMQLERPSFDTWVSGTQAISYEDGVLVVGVKSGYAKDWLENRLYASIQKTVTQIAGRTVSVRFVVRSNSHSTVPQPTEPLDSPEFPDDGMDEQDDLDPHINRRYTFDNFIIGQSNRLAHAGCLAVAENPGTSYNPLFIYGGVGLGKTHLLHAIGNQAMHDKRRTLYVSAETFANELIKSIRNRTTEEFRAKYRNIDVLLLDDVQFLINKERTQEEFFHTFNDLYQENRQIVLSSDRQPRAFVGLEERLRSRFEWGLTADIQPPDLETRMAILEAKADMLHVTLPNSVIEFIAQQVQSNIRELEGALTRVLALARTMSYPLSVQTAEQALGSFQHHATTLDYHHITEVVCSNYGVTEEEIMGRRRTREVAMARQVAMFLMRDMTNMSLPQIGEALGGRDHTTVMHGCNKITALFERDDALRRKILEIKNAVYARVQIPQSLSNG